MRCHRLSLGGSLVIYPDLFADERGYFKETFSSERYRECGIYDQFVQDNVSSSARYVLRGLHGAPHTAKLVQVLAGEAFDVIVDMRAGSPTYLRWEGVRLRASEHAQVYVPQGFLHGFLALADDTLFAYKQSAPYNPSTEIGVAWDDPDLGVAWPLSGRTPTLSEKDRRNPRSRGVTL